MERTSGNLERIPPAECQFPSFGTDVIGIDHRLISAINRRQRFPLSQDAFYIADIGIECKVQARTQHIQINTDILVDHFLPCEIARYRIVCIGISAPADLVESVVAHYFLRVNALYVIVRSYILITQRTVRGPNFKVVDYAADRLEEFLFADPVPQRKRRKESEAIPARELRRSVITTVYLE